MTIIYHGWTPSENDKARLVRFRQARDYQHYLSTKVQGIHCDCPACEWGREKDLEEREREQDNRMLAYLQRYGY
jgi:hypothetical protein